MRVSINWLHEFVEFDQTPEELADTLDYPPRGSPGAHTTKSQAPEAAEPLSAEPQLEGADNAEPRTEPKRR